MKRFAKLAAVTTAIHFVAQFYAWALAPGNTARAETAVPWAWSVLSFPTFYILPPSKADVMFWQGCLANSVLWGLGAAAIARAVRMRSERE